MNSRNSLYNAPAKKVSNYSLSDFFGRHLRLFDTFLTLRAGRPGNTFMRFFGDKLRPEGLGTPVYGGSNRKPTTDSLLCGLLPLGNEKFLSGVGWCTVSLLPVYQRPVSKRGGVLPDLDLSVPICSVCLFRDFPDFFWGHSRCLLIYSLSGPVLRDTARLSQRYPPIARYGVFGVATWPIGCDTPSPFSERFPLGEHARWRCDTPP